MTFDDIQEKLRNGDYDTKLKWPDAYARRDMFSGSRDREEYAQRLAQAEKDKRAYRDDTQRLVKEFKKDLVLAAGLQDRPKLAEAVCLHAWNEGHPDGLGWVLEAFKELAEIVNTKEVLPEGTYAIDLPNPQTKKEDTPFVHYGSYPNRDEALRVARLMFGADDMGRVNLLTLLEEA